ncbi:tripartite tricarboxylate transporter TctB family protein [Halomonas salipaludis]|uniref:DUF1468 domain-containing protein n=1 Tax=Halomonas salipaludis TaxID=2032625 RepID=A0A2A2ES65_9GAMM|nr:tripartite tricarboxylate transporter TctB family protein [Halomonas salipaludis]PAU75177.1 hypothetical protein CK498_18695 [Halomonas salipaludis]
MATRHLGHEAWRDIACGLLFSVLAGVVGYSVLRDTALTATLGRGPDPGPAFLPLIVIGLVGLGGAVILLKGVVNWARSGWLGPPGMAMPGDHLHALLLISSIALLPVLTDWLGFLAASVLFAAPWLAWLGYRRGGGLRRALGHAACFALLIGALLHLVFVMLLNVPL